MNLKVGIFFLATFFFSLSFCAKEQQPYLFCITEEKQLAAFLESIEHADGLFFGSNEQLLSQQLLVPNEQEGVQILEKQSPIQAVLQGVLLKNLLDRNKEKFSAQDKKDRFFYKMADLFYAHYDFLVACGKKYPRRFIAVGASFFSLICFGVWCKLYNKLPYVVLLASYLNNIGYVCVRAYSLATFA